MGDTYTVDEYISNLEILETNIKWQRNAYAQLRKFQRFPRLTGALLGVLHSPARKCQEPEDFE
jgi:hypothetical protein